MEVTNNVPPDIMGDIAVGSFILSILIGGAYEIGTLKASKYTGNAFTCLAHDRIDNPIWATVVGNVVGHASAITNPVEMGIAAASLSAHDAQLFSSYIIARSTIGLGYSIAINFAIRKKATQPILDTIQRGKEFVLEKVDAFTEATGLHALDVALYPPPRYLDYPDNTSGDFHQKPSFVVKDHTYIFR